MERRPGRITSFAAKTVDNLASIGEKLTPKRFRDGTSFEKVGKGVADYVDKLANLGKKLTPGGHPPSSH